MLNNFYKYFRFLKRNNTEEEQIYNVINWNAIYFSFLSNICTGIFNFSNIQKDNEDLLIKSIFQFNYICALKLSDGNIVFCGANPVGDSNKYGMFKEFDLYLTNKTIRKNICDTDIVIGKVNTISGVTYNDICIEFSTILTDIKTSIKSSILLSRLTKVFEVESDKEKESILTEINQCIELGRPYIIKKKSLSTTTNNFIDFDIENTNKYYDTFREVINEFLTLIGLKSLSAPNKKERLITDEVNSNEDIKSSILRMEYNNILNFIDEVNNKFNLNIEIEINENIENIVDETLENFNIRKEKN